VATIISAGIEHRSLRHVDIRFRRSQKEEYALHDSKMIRVDRVEGPSRDMGVATRQLPLCLAGSSIATRAATACGGRQLNKSQPFSQRRDATAEAILAMARTVHLIAARLFGSLTDVFFHLSMLSSSDFDSRPPVHFEQDGSVFFLEPCLACSPLPSNLVLRP